MPVTKKGYKVMSAMMKQSSYHNVKGAKKQQNKKRGDKIRHAMGA